MADTPSQFLLGPVQHNVFHIQMQSKIYCSLMAWHHYPSNNFSHQMTITIMQHVINLAKQLVVANTFWDSKCKQMDISTQFVLQIKILVEGSLRLIYNSDSHITSCYNFGHSSFSAVNITLESAGKIVI